MTVTPADCRVALVYKDGTVPPVDVMHLLLSGPPIMRGAFRVDNG